MTACTERHTAALPYGLVGEGQKGIRRHSHRPDDTHGDCRRGGYLTAPPVIPEMIFRWATAKSTTNGRLIRITYAKMRCQLLR